MKKRAAARKKSPGEKDSRERFREGLAECRWSRIGVESFPRRLLQATHHFFLKCIIDTLPRKKQSEKRPSVGFFSFIFDDQPGLAFTLSAISQGETTHRGIVREGGSRELTMRSYATSAAIFEDAAEVSKSTARSLHGLDRGRGGQRFTTRVLHRADGSIGVRRRGRIPTPNRRECKADNYQAERCTSNKHGIPQGS
jgi:hypothetical protein